MPAETNQQKDEDEKKKIHFKTKWTIGGNGKVHVRLIYNVHAIRKTMRPFSDYVWMCNCW